jgi:hypothetical protein
MAAGVHRATKQRAVYVGPRSLTADRGVKLFVQRALGDQWAQLQTLVFSGRVLRLLNCNPCPEITSRGND